jgi:hypothetical protein
VAEDLASLESESKPMLYPDFDEARFGAMLRGDPVDQQETLHLMRRASDIAFGWNTHNEILVAMQRVDLDRAQELADFGSAS